MFTKSMSFLKNLKHCYCKGRKARNVLHQNNDDIRTKCVLYNDCNTDPPFDSTVLRIFELDIISTSGIYYTIFSTLKPLNQNAFHKTIGLYNLK